MKKNMIIAGLLTIGTILGLSYVHYSQTRGGGRGGGGRGFSGGHMGGMRMGGARGFSGARMGGFRGGTRSMGRPSGMGRVGRVTGPRSVSRIGTGRPAARTGRITPGSRVGRPGMQRLGSTRTGGQRRAGGQARTGNRQRAGGQRRSGQGNKAAAAKKAGAARNRAGRGQGRGRGRGQVGRRANRDWRRGGAFNRGWWGNWWGGPWAGWGWWGLGGFFLSLATLGIIYGTVINDRDYWDYSYGWPVVYDETKQTYIYYPSDPGSWVFHNDTGDDITVIAGSQQVTIPDDKTAALQQTTDGTFSVQDAEEKTQFRATEPYIEVIVDDSNKLNIQPYAGASKEQRQEIPAPQAEKQQAADQMQIRTGRPAIAAPGAGPAQEPEMVEVG